MLHNERLLKENAELKEDIEKLTRPLGIWVLESEYKTLLFNVSFDKNGRANAKVDFSLTWKGLREDVVEICTFKFQSSPKSFRDLHDNIMGQVRNFVNRETVEQNRAAQWWENKE